MGIVIASMHSTFIFKTKRLIYILLTLALSSNAFANSESNYQEAIVNTSLHKTGIPTKLLTTIQGTKVRMVVFTTYDGYKTSDTTLGVNIWTTVAPDVKQLCRQYVKQKKVGISHQQLNLWLAKLLGLPEKNSDKRRFVELEVPVIQAYYGTPVSTIGIFRPCTDPRIGAHRDESPICPKQMNPADLHISSDYKTWFINSSIASHTLDNGIPWTEYGYTYNWNEQASSTVGVSEFVVMKGTPVTVLANPDDSATPYISAEEYCGINLSQHLKA